MEQVVTNTHIVQLPMFTQWSHLAHWVATLPALDHSKQHSRSAIGWRSVWNSLGTFWYTYVHKWISIHLMFVIPYILVTCFFHIQLDVLYSLFLSWKVFSSTYFRCYLHPSSGAQLQCIAIGFYLWKIEVLVSSGVEVYFELILCVLVFKNFMWYLCVGVCHRVCFGIAWFWCVVSS
jgi:hypothetical protein